MLLSRRVVSRFLGSSVISSFFNAPFSLAESLSGSSTNIESVFFNSYLERRYYEVARLGRRLFREGITRTEEAFNFDQYIDSLIYTGDIDAAKSAISQKSEYFAKIEVYNHSRVDAIIEVQNGDIHRLQSKWDEAELSYRTAIRKVQKEFGRISGDLEMGFSDLPQYFVRACNGLALVKIQQNQVSEAKKLFRRSIQVATARPNTLDKMIGHQAIPLATTYLHLSESLLQAREYEEASYIAQNAIDLLHKVSGLSPAYSADYNLIIARALLARGDNEGAANAFEKSINVARADKENFGSTLVQSLLECWRFLKITRSVDDSLAVEALQTAEQIFGVDSLQAARCKLEVLEFSEEALAKAAAVDLERLLGVLRKYYSENATEVARSKLLAAKYWVTKKSFDAAMKILDTVSIEDAARVTNYIDIMSRMPGSSEIFRRTFIAVQLSANNTASQSVAEYMSRSIISDKSGKDLLREYQNQKAILNLHLANLVSFSSTATSKSENGIEFQELSDVISREEVKLRKLEKELRKAHPEYFDFIKASYLEPDKLRSLLSDEEALVVIDIDDRRGGDYVWALTRDNEQWHRLNTTRGQVESITSQLVSQLDPNTSKSFEPSVAYELHQIILGGIKGVLNGKSQLIFVINGVLASLPPHVLVLEDPAAQELRSIEWLIKTYSISIFPTVQSLAMLRGQVPLSVALKPMRAYADITYSPDRQVGNVSIGQRGLAEIFRDGVADIKLLAGASPLPATGPEVKSVMATLGGNYTDIITGRLATESDVKASDLKDYRVIYFATHGLLAGEVEELAKLKAEPALLFALPENPTSEDDGLLTASEITQLRLNAEWVVLSACNTAAGGKPGGAALSGLAQAFLHAGSRALLVSHWAVSDDATRVLMVKLFELYGRAGTKGADALRLAILHVMNDTSHPEWANPTYWAPFIIVGEPTTAMR